MLLRVAPSESGMVEQSRDDFGLGPDIREESNPTHRHFSQDFFR